LTHVAELHHPDLAELADTAVRGLRLQEELGQRHLLTSEEIPHDANGDLRPTATRAPGNGIDNRIAFEEKHQYIQKYKHEWNGNRA